MDQPTSQFDEASRAAALMEAERMALKLLDAIEAGGFIEPGRTEREIELDIRALAKEKFGIERDWHKRIVRGCRETRILHSLNPSQFPMAPASALRWRALDGQPKRGEALPLGADVRKRHIRVIRDLSVPWRIPLW